MADEVGCNVYRKDSISYIKSIPPEPKEGGRRTNVNISIDILAILEIAEVMGHISLQFEATLVWYNLNGIYDK